MKILLFAVACLTASHEPFPVWVAERVEESQLPESIGERLGVAELLSLPQEKPTLPFAELTAGVRLPNRDLWVGSPRGLMYLEKGAPRWRLFHSRRWLPDDHVQAISVNAEGEVFVKTPSGVGKIYQRTITCDQKMAEINDVLQKQHVREGLIASTNLKSAGDLMNAAVQSSNDNDGLWTSLYIAAEAFRYAVTGDLQAKKNARRSLDALMFLEKVTEIPGFAARSIIPYAEDPKRHDGQWHPSSDKKWWWKGDTSSDEVVGHYFAYSIYYNVAADEAERAEIRPYVERITDHIIANGFNYVGPSGKPTTWGVWAPDKLNGDLRRVGDRGLNSLQLLSFLKVAEHIVGKPVYAEKSKELIEKHAYHINTVEQKKNWPPGFVNHSDDELAFLAYYPLLIHEKDPELRKIYLASIRRSWMIERPERSPLFNYIYGAALQASHWTEPSRRPDGRMVQPHEYDAEECVEWFRDVPLDLVCWTINNSSRQDVTVQGTNRFRKLKSQSVLPISERHVMRWNGDPYTLDGGSDGRQRDDGTFILLPYWMGRYHRLID
ncbi:MAG: hypothetical protein U1D30_26920 [Planctomycetota bacterium]